MTRKLRAGEFSQLNAFAAVAQARSFRQAATALRLDPSTLSHAVRALEKRLGTRLLHRTTRSVTPTETGTRLLNELSPALSVLGTALERVAAPPHLPSGTVKIIAPRLAVRMLLMPVLGRLNRDYPHLTLDIVVEEQVEDRSAAAYDLSIRFGDAITQDLIAIPLLPSFTTAVVGSPGYFAAHPAPTTPRDLANHRCIGCRCGPEASLYRWRFEKDGIADSIDVTGALITNDPDLMRLAALEGGGLWYGVEEFVKTEILDGRLIRVLANWSPCYPGFHLCYPGGAPLGQAERVVIDALKNARDNQRVESVA